LLPRKSPKRRPSLKLICVDLFCGAGGTSEGLIEAAEQLEIEVDLVAINHWPVAIATHSANHPRARHICARIEEIRPREVIPGGRVHLLVASPECTHFSTAAGGRPVEDQRRIPAWGVVHWLQELYVDNLIIENVPEFRNWGPLGVNGKPLKSRKGETYRAYLEAIRACGYKVEERIICCADYGDATTRKRLFIVATRTGKPSWPETTHSETGEADLFSTKSPWVAAREIIDWKLVGKSIFARKKPLAATTLKRIAAGMKKFNQIDIASFLGIDTDATRSTGRASAYSGTDEHVGPTKAYVVNMKGRSDACSIGNPAPTVTTRPHLGLAQPIVVSFSGSDIANNNDSLFADAVQPFVIGIDHHGGNGACVNGVEEPLTTVTTKQRHGLVNAYLIGAGGPARAAEPRLVNKPLNTVLTRQSMALVEPRVIEAASFMVAAGGPQGKGRRPRSLDRPLDTVLTENHDALVQPYIVVVNHSEGRPEANGGTERCHTVGRPLPTVTTRNGYGVVTAYLTKYYGTATAQSVEKPLDTVTTRDRFGLVESSVIDQEFPVEAPSRLCPLIPLGDGKFLDIRFRMLKSHELAAAMGFPKDYVFTGNQATVVKQIGNAVPPQTAKALCKERLRRYAKGITPTPAAA
jgi:DNA (cytosine-5)-methyltransferase 1